MQRDRKDVVAQVRRAKAECSSECKSLPSKGRSEREAIPAAVSEGKIGGVW